MTRSVPEWRGATPDTTIPPRVKARVFDRYNGSCQHCMRKLFPWDKWECDHIIALCNGGEHRENNLRPVCSWCHRRKTAQDVAEKAKVASVRKKHIGAKGKRRTIPGRRFNGDPIPSRWV